MALTDHQAQYLAYEFTRRCPSDSIESLAAALIDAQVVDEYPGRVPMCVGKVSLGTIRGYGLRFERMRPALGA